MNPPAQMNGRASSMYPKSNPKHEQLLLPPLMALPQLPPSVQHAPPTTPSSGGDVESILKMMTSTMAPLTKIAATPRTEVEVQQPSKQHVYAELPPLFKPPSKPGMSHKPIQIHRSTRTVYKFKNNVSVQIAAPILPICDDVKRVPPLNAPSALFLERDRYVNKPM